MTAFTRVPPAPLSPLATPHAVRMRDGVHLATDVYLPSTEAEVAASAAAASPSAGAGNRRAEGGTGVPALAGGTAPGDTVLIRLPYDKCGSYCFIPLIAEYFMARDYRVVTQDVRGKFRSEGAALLFVNEVDDGYDTIEWITQQPWSNGRVAMWGDSYYGYTQLAAAASGHPALKAISPRVTGTALGNPVVREPGSRTSAVEMGETLIYPLSNFFEQDTYYWDMEWARRDFAAQCEELMASVGRRSISYDQWYPHPVVLPRFPGGSAFAGHSVPTLQTIGWWDNCAPYSWQDYAEVHEHYPNWAAHWHVRIEPIDHENFFWDEPAQDKVEDRSEAQIRALLPAQLDPTLQFFDVFVRGNGAAADIPRVTWNLAGTDEWRTDSAWPPPEAHGATLYATPGGNDSAAGGLAAVPGAAATASWIHDPADLVPSSTDNAFAFLLTKPDESALAHRDDVLVFTSAAAVGPVDLAGPVSARAGIRSTGPVMDLFIRLLDVAPDGTAHRIARGQIQLTDATEAEAVAIDMGHVGYRLAAGHRLRLHVSSSDFPEFVPQPGTGCDPWAWGDTAANTQTIELGGESGLAVTLPVLAGALPGASDGVRETASSREGAPA